MLIQSRHRWDPGVFVVVVGSSFQQSAPVVGSALSVRLAVVTAASAMVDALHDGPWTVERILAAVAAKDTVSVWSDHNGALKYHRDKLPLTTDHMLTTDEWVQKVVHGVRQDYTFGEWVKWDWRTMIAAFTDVDRRRVIGTGITAVAVSKRAGSYDHHMSVAAIECNWATACEQIVDFSITRTDGTVVLVHHAKSMAACIATAAWLAMSCTARA